MPRYPYSHTNLTQTLVCPNLPLPLSDFNRKRDKIESERNRRVNKEKEVGDVALTPSPCNTPYDTVFTDTSYRPHV